MAGKGLEVVALVERSSFAVDGVDEHDSSSCPTSGVEDRCECVDEKVTTESTSLHRGIECELGQEDRRNLVGRATSKPRWRVVHDAGLRISSRSFFHAAAGVAPWAPNRESPGGRTIS